MDKPIRVAQIIGIANNGGVESIIMNYYRNIDRNKVQFDFFVESESKIINKKEIEEMGGKVIIIPPYTKLFKYTKELKRIFKENNYDVVHSNMNTLSVFPLRAAKKAGVKIRIAHSHSTSNKKEWKKHLLKSVLKKFSKTYSTHYFSCGEDAGRYQFGDKTFDDGKVTVIKNAVDIDKFKFNIEKRNTIRGELNITKEFVIGHVGRFMNVKNQLFLIDVFSEILKTRKDVRLLLVGEGPMEEKIRQRVGELGINENVIFYGTTSDVASVYSAMDVFAFPSLYEGFGLVALEAQANGLPTVVSEHVPMEACATSYVFRLKLESEKWLEKLNQILTTGSRNNIDKSIDDYKISRVANDLLKKYEEILREE